jgi:hypothetical protein
MVSTPRIGIKEPFWPSLGDSAGNISQKAATD